MHMGTRGRQLVVRGSLRATGSGYNGARSNVQALIDAIEQYLWADAADYTFKGETYSNVVFDKFQLVPAAGGRIFRWLSTGYVAVDFVCFMRCLI